MKSKQESINYNKFTQIILSECERALNAVEKEQTQVLIDAITTAKAVFFIGIGRVLLSMEAIAKRLDHLGISTHIVGEITEPAITPDDLLIVGSGSGESLIPVAIAQKAVKLGVKVAYIGSNMQSTLANLAALKVRIPVLTKLGLPDEISSDQPMTSLFEQTLMLYGDAIAMMIIQQKEIDLSRLWHQHANLE